MQAAKATNWKDRLDGLVTVLMLCVTCVALWAFLRGPVRGTDATDLPEGPIALGSLISVGDTSSSVAIVLFSDFQCPFCADLAVNVMPELKRSVEEEKRILLQFAHLPLENIHPAARYAGEAVECARAQHLEWQLHDALFLRTAARQLNTRDDVLGVVRTIAPGGVSEIESCIAQGSQSRQVQEQVELAALLGIRSTPTFVVGRRSEDGFYPSSRIVGAVKLDILMAAVGNVAGVR